MEEKNGDLESQHSNTPILHRLIMAGEIQLKLKEGDVAPEFSAATSGGGKVSLADFKGKNVVLYFYPRDDTPGCTKEACAFRDHFAGFRKKGAVVFGVSTDPVRVAF